MKRASIHILALSAGLASLLVTAPSMSQDALKDTPFNYGDHLPDLVASCEDIRDWASKAPRTDARIDLAIKGKLSRVSSDAALVYLVMCDKPYPKVTCVTYQRNGMSAGDVVQFGGGFRQVDAEEIVLDPCLASRD